MKIEKYTFGTGDRFGKEGEAQLRAIQQINELGISVTPVWNKSHREHKIVETEPPAVAKEAANAVEANSWDGNYYVDADHIGMDTVDEFLDHSDFFTIDVAHFIGQNADEADKKEFINHYLSYIGDLSIPGIDESFKVSEAFLEKVADTYLVALQQVKKIYDYICSKKGEDNFIAEVSIDECEIPQTPRELFFILAELKRKGIELQTIAPKFTGLFAKGVDYIGDLDQFAKEFEQDVAVIQYAVKELGLPSSLKLSIHSGSDKFSLYPIMNKVIEKFDTGIHVKTAGTTWLEEVIGLAQSGDDGLKMAKKIYLNVIDRYDELTAPYATVLRIEKEKLPSVEEVNTWSGEKFSDTLVHDQSCADYNPSFRQIIHVGYKIAAEMGQQYLDALDDNREVIEKHVTHNLLERHLKPIFLH